MAPGDSFLGAHGATLEPQGVGRWQLSYQVGGFDYGEGLPSSVDVALPIAAATREEALLLARVILWRHKTPEKRRLWSQRGVPVPILQHHVRRGLWPASIL
jgi:hypothetical protein